MFGSEVLDAVIGLFFIYLILSLFSSAALELIESVVRRRAVLLEQGLRQMLGNRNGDGIVAAIYKHALISSLFEDEYQPWRQRQLPSYIPSESFAIALMDTMGIHGPRGDTPAQAVISSSANLSPEWIKNLIQSNSNSSPGVTQGLLALGDSVGYEPEALRQAIAGWYDSVMDQVSGKFKRETQIMLLILGLLISFAVNADSIAIATSLTTERSVRQVLVAAAVDATKAQNNPVQSAASSPYAAPPASPLPGYLSDIRDAGIPLGWHNSNIDMRSSPSRFRDWLLKAVGIFFTGIVIVFGSSFCFDVLGRFVRVRCPVKPMRVKYGEVSRS